MFGLNKSTKITAEQALPGRDEEIAVPNTHFVNGHPIKAPFPDGLQHIQFGMGCFWGAEKKFWSLPGVYSTAVGYTAGFTANAHYREVCSGMTGHNEVVLVVFDPKVIDLETLLNIFWESHNPTQGMRQGNDAGTQYRSGIYTSDNTQLATAKASLKRYQEALNESGIDTAITTEIQTASPFYYAEEYHQQYLAKNPNGYCGLGGTGVKCKT